ncbi:MAG TPA: helix-turn-helix domain-containing GNAT family N-acetyltransferase [Xanthobacteraceae bacterium]|jgi:DNA-binding MarR family transcriptional regulator/N-acetylglutamate synthase-like GNAT family acetyltransferase|nr:helix-turn-helix domain-containing GNAT family N-acetyltransferase [Xanthobacteraceae bacterium]
MPGRALQDRIAALRRFNRFYTRKLGVLEEHFLHSPFSLAEARVLYELAHGDRATAKDIGGALGLDAGYLSRILDRFARARLISRAASLADGRQSLLALTPKGKAAFAPLDRRSREEIGVMLRALPERDQRRLVQAAGTIEALLAGSRESEPAISLRQAKAGDFGWIVSRHGALYAEEYGWSESFEALVADIIAAFIRERDAKRERCWIAELDGERAGSVTLVRESDKTAKLRILFVEPEARGHGVGGRLVEECIRFARAAGYRKITLWTQSILVAARAIYLRAGFKKVREAPHASFGKKLVGEYWELKL